MDDTGYVDTNVFIYWLGDHPSFGEVAYEWIRKIDDAPRGGYVTSGLTINETLVIIAGLTGESLSDFSLVEGVIDSITSLKGLTIEALGPQDLTEAVTLMKEYGLDYEDSLHLTIALRKDVEEIISNDEDFDKTPLKRTFFIESFNT